MKRIGIKQPILALGLVGIACLAAGCGLGRSWDTIAKGTPVPTPPLVAAAVKAACSGDMARLRPHLTATMAGVLSPGNVRVVKEGLDSLGAVQAIKTWRQPTWEGLTVYRFQVSMKHGDALGFLAEDSSGRIAGLRFEPVWTQRWDRTGKGMAVVTPAVVTKVVDATLAGNYPELQPLLSPDMVGIVTPASMAKIKLRLHYLGPLKSVSTIRQNGASALTNYHFIMHMARGPVDGYLVLDTHGKIAGLRLTMGELTPKQIFSIAFSR